MDPGGNGVRRNPCGRPDRERGAHDVHSALHAEASHVGEPVIERRHRVPEIPLGAADAGVPRSDRPAGAPVPLENRTGREGGRPFAAYVIQAPALSGVLVVEHLHVLACIEVGPPRALVVDALAVGEERAPVRISGRQAVEGEKVGHRGRHHVADGRAAGHVDHRLVLDHLGDADSPGGIGPGRLHAAPVGAGPDRHDRCGALRRLLEDRLRGTAADRGIHPPIGEWHGAGHDEEVFPCVVLHGLLERSLGLVARRSHDRV